MRVIIHWLITAVALVVAAYLVPGIRVESANAWLAFGAMAVILGLVNAIVRPVMRILSIPLIILTLGLFLLVINALTLMLASWIAVNVLRVGFYVDGFWPALLGSIVVSVVSLVLSMALHQRR